MIGYQRCAWSNMRHAEPCMGLAAGMQEGQHLGACLRSQCSSQLRPRIGQASLQLRFQLAPVAHGSEFCHVPPGCGPHYTPAACSRGCLSCVMEHWASLVPHHRCHRGKHATHLLGTLA